MIKKLALILLITFSFSVFTGCNTFRGLGKDIESLGKAMKKVATNSEENE